MHNSIETDILYTVIYIAILSGILLHHQRNINNKIGVGSVILLTYIIYPIIGAFWFFADIPTYGQTEPLRLLPFLYLAMMFWIALKPVLQYDQLQISRITPPSMMLFYLFVFVYTICAIIRIPEIIGGTVDGIRALLTDDGAGQYMYSNRQGGGDLAFNHGIANIFAVVFNIFSPVICLFFFYYLTIERRLLSVEICLIICILVQTFFSLGRGDRTLVTMQFFNIIGGYMIVKPMLSAKIKHIVRIFMIFIAISIAIPFLALSVSRFGNKQGGIADGFIYYLGEAPYYFNNYAFEANGERHGDRTCNYFKEVLGMHPPYGIQGVRNAYPNAVLEDSIFSSFVGDFVVDFGIIPASIIFIVFSLIFCRLTRNDAPNQIPFYRLILVFFAMSVCMQGGMYLFSYAFEENITILAIFFSYCIFRIDYHLHSKKNTQNNIPID